MHFNAPLLWTLKSIFDEELFDCSDGLLPKFVSDVSFVDVLLSSTFANFADDSLEFGASLAARFLTAPAKIDFCDGRAGNFVVFCFKAVASLLIFYNKKLRIRNLFEIFRAIDRWFDMYLFDCLFL